MKRYTYRLLKLLFLVELGAFGYFYLYGSQGLKAVDLLKAQIEQVKKEIEKVEAEVADLQVQNQNWQEHPFYKEKIAREQLQMARPDDQIFYW